MKLGWSLFALAVLALGTVSATSAINVDQAAY